MDILDQLTDKARLQAMMDQRKKATTLIDADQLSAAIKAKVIGQDAVSDAVAQTLRRRMAINNREKPIAVFCFAGPPGVGKTYFAKVLSKYLDDGKRALLFYDMAQFSEAHAASSLFGSPKGYVGSNSYGKLTGDLRNTPKSIVLLDEFEKAHGEVHKRFLSAWNDGFVTESSNGEKVSTKDAIFILTTNAAAREIGELADKCGDDLDTLSKRAKLALESVQFAPEVLSRIDDVFAFRPLKGMDIARVVALELTALLAQYEVQIESNGIDPQILLSAMEQFENSSRGGVREIARGIEKMVVNQVLEARSKGASKIRLQQKPDSEAITVEVVS